MKPKFVPEMVNSAPVETGRLGDKPDVTLGESKVKLPSREPATLPMTATTV